jgi:predicted RNA-binding Zn-ribbon protein involved in translation (DUF1610 family)
MMKFRCQSCGHRIAVPPRMMGRLVNCPECGGVTHPLAEQLVGGKPTAERDPEPAPSKATAVAAHQVRHCDNCGRLIGRLEESHTWRGNVVCVGCHANLAHAAPVVGPATPKRKPAASVVAGNAKTDVQVRAVNRIARKGSDDDTIDLPKPASRTALFLSTRPVRILLALCTVALAIYFVYSFLQIIGLVANVVVVGLLLLIALLFLFRPGPSPTDGAGGSNRSLERRP